MSAVPTSREYFAGVAGRWDKIRSGYFDEAIRDGAIAAAGLTAGDIAADVGTGTGFMIQGLAPLAAKVHGFDQSPEMLAVARRNLADFRNVELIEASGQNLPLVAGSLDAVFANMYLHHVPDPSAAVAEMVRVLRPGGVLVLTDADEHDQTWMREAMADQWLGFKRSEIRAWFAQAGLVDVNVDCAKGRCCPTAEDGRRLALGIFVATGFKPQ